jgi:hypothetical protein
MGPYPSDRIEDGLSGVESAAGVFEALHTSRDPPTEQQWVDLCTFLALTACRRPEVMQRGHLRAIDMAWQLADVDAQPDRDSLLGKHQESVRGRIASWYLRPTGHKGLAALVKEAEAIENLSPQDPKLPAQISLEAVTLVANAIVVQNLFLLRWSASNP